MPDLGSGCRRFKSCHLNSRGREAWSSRRPHKSENALKWFKSRPRYFTTEYSNIIKIIMSKRQSSSTQGCMELYELFKRVLHYPMLKCEPLIFWNKSCRNTGLILRLWCNWLTLLPSEQALRVRISSNALNPAREIYKNKG